MKKLGLALGLSAALMLGGGCKKQVSDNDAIRAGILQHLNGVGTLNFGVHGRHGARHDPKGRGDVEEAHALAHGHTVDDTPHGLTQLLAIGLVVVHAVSMNGVPGLAWYPCASSDPTEVG